MSKSFFRRKIVKPFASIKLAVVIVLSLATVTAWGTFVEAEYDATAAQKLVYHSVWMYGVMILLATSLIAVMIDRWPWKQRHTGFVLAHIGILILLGGSILTSIWGVDGSMSVGIGEKSRLVEVGQTDLSVYTSLDGSKYSKLFDHEVDFFVHPPSDAKPVRIEVPNGNIQIVDYMPYAFREQKVLPSESDGAGAAIRFQLLSEKMQNAKLSVSEWLVQPAPGRAAVKDLGPAQVVLTGEKWQNVDNRNAIILRPRAGSEKIDYEVYTAREPKKVKRGTIEAGETVETGWRMGLVMRVLKFMPKAKESVEFKKAERPTPLTTAAILVQYNVTSDQKTDQATDQKNNQKQWIALNSMLKLFSDQAVYIVTYANRRLDVNFDLHLKEFKIGHYQGTAQPASYASVVDVPGLGEKVISMNEPLEHGSYTFYQSSFDSDESGKPVLSVFSVNRDPGRWVKYLGSLLIVFGTLHLFYFKRKVARAASQTTKSQAA